MDITAKGIYTKLTKVVMLILGDETMECGKLFHL